MRIPESNRPVGEGNELMTVNPVENWRTSMVNGVATAALMMPAGVTAQSVGIRTAGGRTFVVVCERASFCQSPLLHILKFRLSHFIVANKT